MESRENVSHSLEPIAVCSAVSTLLGTDGGKESGGASSRPALSHDPEGPIFCVFPDLLPQAGVWASVLVGALGS